MPVFDNVCEKCAAEVRTMSKSVVTHKGCGGPLKRSPKGATSQQIDTLDNGVMVRRIERLTDIEELVHERAQDDRRKS